MSSDYRMQLLPSEEAAVLTYFNNLIEIKSLFQHLFIDFPYDPPCNISAKIVYLTTGLIEKGGVIFNNHNHAILSG